jgi:tetratricopeptide (TPR) repeat protein
LAVALAALALAASAEAAPTSTSTCQPHSAPPEPLIAACDAALQDPKLAPADRAHLVLIRGVAEQSSRKSAEAAADFGQVIELDTKQATAVIAAARRPGANFAQTSLEFKLEPLVDDLATAYANRGVIHLSQGEGDLAAADLTAAVGLAPKNGNIFIYRSSAYTQLGKNAQAITDATRAVQLAPDSAMAWNARCWARAVGNSELPAARSDCDHALTLARSDGQRAEILDSRALVGYREGKFELALADENAALGASPAAEAPKFMRGLAEERLGRGAEGRVDIVAALAADPKIADEYARWGLKPD